MENHGNCHTHQHCNCIHCLHFCSVCNIVYCCKCGQEWHQGVYYNYWGGSATGATSTTGGSITLTNCGEHTHL